MNLAKDLVSDARKDEAYLQRAGVLRSLSPSPSPSPSPPEPLGQGSEAADTPAPAWAASEVSECT